VSGRGGWEQILTADDARGLIDILTDWLEDR
jgi:hypothetical protein